MKTKYFVTMQYFVLEDKEKKYQWIIYYLSLFIKYVKHITREVSFIFLVPIYEITRKYMCLIKI